MMTVDEALMGADDANYSSETEITLAAEVRRLSDDVDQLRCQLAGCGVAALENTVGSRSRRAVRGDYGHSASYEDVCNAVDREIALREENERLKSNPPQSLSSIPPDCCTCTNRGHINGLSQETYCDSCMWYGAHWKKNNYNPLPEPAP